MVSELQKKSVVDGVDFVHNRQDYAIDYRSKCEVDTVATCHHLPGKYIVVMARPPPALRSAPLALNPRRP